MVSVLYNHIFSPTVPIMLALCLMLLATYYAQNYADIIGWSLPCTYGIQYVYGTEHKHSIVRICKASNVVSNVPM